jgi:hypothetical protein
MHSNLFTPTFNRRRTLPRLFEDLEGQSFRNFEWLVAEALFPAGPAYWLRDRGAPKRLLASF